MGASVGARAGTGELRARGVDLVDQLGLARPQQHLAPVAGEHLRERGAPGARAEDADREPLTP